MDYEVNLTELPDCQLKLEFSIPVEVVNKIWGEVFEEIRKKASLKGFRKGRVPPEIVKNKLKNLINEETRKQIMYTSLSDFIKKKNLEFLGTPVLNFEELEHNKSFRYQAIIEHPPKFKPKNYINIKVKKEIKEVTPKDVDKVMKDLQERNAYLIESKDTVIKKNHFPIVSLKAFEDGKIIKSLSCESTIVDLNSASFIEGLNEILTGRSKGDIFDAKLKIRDDYPEKEFAGRVFDFKIFIKAIKERKLPEINDEFAKNFNCKDLKQLREKIFNQLSKKNEEDMRRKMLEQIYDKLLLENDFELPKNVLEIETNEIFEGVRRNYNLRLDDKKELERLKLDCRMAAIRNLKIHFLLKAIAKEKGIEVSDEELEEKRKEMSASFDPKLGSFDEYFKKHRERILNRMLKEKVENFLLKNSKITEVK